MQIYHNKYAQSYICANTCQQIYVNQNVSRGWWADQEVGRVALGQEGSAAAAFRRLRSSLLLIEPFNFHFPPPFPVIPR